MIGAKTILVVAVVDRDLDGYGRINQTNNGCWDTDEVRVSAVSSTRETVQQELVDTLLQQHRQGDIWVRVP